jgi:nitrogen fixation protein
MGIKEDVYYEGGPHLGDLILGILLGFTIIALPITIGAIVRALWLRYRITNRRVSITSGWLGRDQTDIIYTEVKSIIRLPRAIGLWGDVVITLKNGTRLEMRAVPKFREICDFMAEKVADKIGTTPDAILSR